MATGTGLEEAQQCAGHRSSPELLEAGARNYSHLGVHTGVAVLVGVQARQRSRLRTLTLVCGERSGTQMALARSGMKGDFRTVTEVPPPW